MQELDDRWLVDLVDYEVMQCGVAYGFYLYLLSTGQHSATVSIEGWCSYHDAMGRTHEIDDDAMGPAFAPLLVLMTQTVQRAEAFKDGSLRLAFGDGSELFVRKGAESEPWNIAGENGLRVVSVPGGDLAIWLPVESTHE